MSDRVKNTIFSLLSIGLGLLVTLLLLEVGLRVLYPRDDYYVDDPLLGQRLRPNSEGWHSSVGEFRVHYRINAAGLRGAEIAQDVPEDVFRTLMLGDSFVAAFEVEENETTPAQLEAELAAMVDDGAVEVINAGVPGYSTVQQTIYLEQEGLAYEPDLVLIVFYIANDIIDNRRYADFTAATWLRSPAQAADDDAAAVDAAATASPPADAAAPPADQPRPRARLNFKRMLDGLRDTLSQSLLARYSVEMARHNPAIARLYGQLAASEEEAIPLDHEIFSPDPVPEIEEAWQVTRLTFEHLAAISAEHDIPIAVILWPDPAQFNEDWWDMRVYAYPGMARYDPHLPEQRLGAMLDDVGLPHHSLRAAFTQAWDAQDGQRLIYRVDGHATAELHAIAAENIADFLQEADLIPDG